MKIETKSHTEEIVLFRAKLSCRRFFFPQRRLPAYGLDRCMRSDRSRHPCPTRAGAGRGRRSTTGPVRHPRKRDAAPGCRGEAGRTDTKGRRQRARYGHSAISQRDGRRYAGASAARSANGHAVARPRAGIAPERRSPPGARRFPRAHRQKVFYDPSRFDAVGRP